MAAKHRLPKENYPATIPTLVVSFVFLVIRMSFDHGLYYSFFIVNAALAWIPFALSEFIWRDYRNLRQFRLRNWLIYLVVILFLPNTFYMITDFVHVIDPVNSLMVWLDVVMLGSFAWLGMLYGFITVRKMQLIIEDLHGTVTGWVGVVMLIVLSSIGIYFGRVARFYSWDALLNAGGFTKYILTNLPNPKTEAEFWAFVAAFTLLLGTIYISFFRPSDR
jgi:uncharacterized membrane protein